MTTTSYTRNSTTLTDVTNAPTISPTPAIDGQHEKTLGFVAGDLARRRDAEGTPHVAVVSVGIDTHRAVRIRPAVLAPKPLLDTAVLVAVRVHHGRYPDLGPGQPARNLRIVGPLDQLLGQQEWYLHGDPFARMVTAHEEDGTVNLLTEGREGWSAADPTRQPRHR